MLLFTVLAVWCASGYAQGAVPAQDKPFYPEAAHAQHFAEFKVTYHKQYATPEEERRRFTAFKNNLAKINELNSLDEHAVYDINEQADLSDEEIEATYTDFDVNEGEINSSFNKIMVPEQGFSDDRDEPEPFDWRDKGVVTKVKDQKDCDAGYAFAHIESVEGAYAVKYKKLMEFSTQEVIDCDDHDRGCKGGTPITACMFTGHRGFVKEDDYKYVGRQGNCTYDKKKVVGQYHFCAVVLSKENNVVYNFWLGPLAATIDRRAFRFYRSGVITKCNFKGYNHAVLMTGYGKEHGVPFWTVKNSKGEKWGEKGYARIKRGVACLGIAQPNTLTTVYDFE